MTWKPLRLSPHHLSAQRGVDLGYNANAHSFAQSGMMPHAMAGGGGGMGGGGGGGTPSYSASLLGAGGAATAAAAGGVEGAMGTNKNPVVMAFVSVN